jgi:hypothetical protein
MKTLIESMSINCKKYKNYGSYSNYMIKYVLNMLDIKKEYVRDIDKESNYLRGITIFLPNSELHIRLWDTVAMGEVITTRFSVFEEQLNF